jgi:hypothetical protein
VLFSFALFRLLASAKLFLIPLGIFAFLVFLLVLGAIALGLSMGLLWVISSIVHIPRRRFERRSRRA